MPAGHGSTAGAPAGQKLPLVHGLHAVEPGTSWNSPPSQGEHKNWPADEVKVPGVQFVGVAEPTEHEVPAGQVMQSRVRFDKKPTAATTLWSA